jgi:hypothetical protein
MQKTKALQIDQSRDYSRTNQINRFNPVRTPGMKAPAMKAPAMKAPVMKAPAMKAPVIKVHV